jgi:hypothetical protein
MFSLQISGLMKGALIGQDSQPAHILAISWLAQQRLHRVWRRLDHELWPPQTAWALSWTTRETQTGALAGAPPSGRPIQVRGMTICSSPPARSSAVARSSIASPSRSSSGSSR